MNTNLIGKKVAILATEGFEQNELERPREALEEAGALTEIISPQNGRICAWDEDQFGDMQVVDVLLADARASDYDALLLPGGVMNSDQLRAIPDAVEFVRAFFEADKPVAAICHGSQILIEANVVRGRKMTSYHSIRTDLINAGAEWIDEKVVVDQGLITSRRLSDVPHFNRRMIEEIAEGVQAWQPA